MAHGRAWASITAVLMLALIAAPVLSPVLTVEAQVLGPKPGDPLWSVIFYSYVAEAEWSPDGERLAVGMAEEWTLRIFDREGVVLRSASMPGPAEKLEWRPDGQYLAVAADTRFLVVDPDTMDIVFQEDIGSKITDLAWSPDGRFIALTTAAGDLYIMDMAAGVVYYSMAPQVPALTVDWSPDGRIIVVGDGAGYLYVYQFPNIYDYEILPSWGEGIFSARWSPDGSVLAVASATMLRLYRPLENGSIVEYARLDTGTRGQLAWSPCSQVLVVPAETLLVVVSRDGYILRELPTPGTYPVRYAHWNPASFSTLVVTGHDPLTDTTGMYVVFSGALYTVIARPPIIEACYAGSCGDTIRVSAGERPTTITLHVEAETLDSDEPVTARVALSLWPLPFEAKTLDASLAVTTPAYNVTVQDGKAMVSVLRSDEAILTVSTTGKSKTVRSLAVLLDPGTYTLTLTLPQPDDYLGPDWVLTKKITVTLPPGKMEIYDYTWFNLANVTGTLRVVTEPGAQLTLIWPNATVGSIIASGEAAYTVPAGYYEYLLQLPQADNVLVANPAVLAKRAPLRVFPGETVSLAFTYMDVLGKLIVEAPAGSLLRIQGDGIMHETVLDDTTAQYYAQPGRYTLTLRVEPPPNWVGPEPPLASMTVDVVQGGEVVANFFYDPMVLQYVQLVERATNLTITAPPGYEVVIDVNGSVYRIGEVADTAWVTVPPGTIRVALVDPETGEVVDEVRVDAAGGTVQVVLREPQAQAPPQQAVYTPEQPAGERNLLLLALVIIIPVAAGIAAYMILSRRAKTRI